MLPVYDSWNSAYKSRFGALRQGEKCTFALRIPKGVGIEFPPVMVSFRTGFKEQYLMMNKVSSTEGYTEYSAEFTAVNEGVHYYYFVLINGGERRYIKKRGAHEGIIGEGGLFQLTVYEKGYDTPDFIKGGVMYQIFPDRFNKGDYSCEKIPGGRVLRDDWDGIPFYKPDSEGHVWNNDYFGGNFKGIMDKLSYLEDLGVTCIYLNPIFEAHENHRYNTADYRKADPLLGTNEDFKKLCAEAKKRGISIVLDGVFSHTGADSVYFNKFNRYKTKGAYNSKDSEFYPWYSFINYPNEYESWWGITTLPNVKENNPQYTEFICGEGGVLDLWFSLGASGFRLDVADELPDEFLDNLRTAVKRNGEEKLLIGEVWEDASTKESYGVKRRYLIGKQLDSTMNYPFRSAILDYCKGLSGRDFSERVGTILENYPAPSVNALMNFVSTHDVERAINVLGGESLDGKSKEWQSTAFLSKEQYEKGRKRLKTAMALQFFLPGVPCIYYGDEAGLQGYKDPFNRRCYPWGKEDKELISYVRELSRIRKNNDLFKDGLLKFLWWDEEVMVFQRFREGESRRLIIFVNRGDSYRDVSVKSDFIGGYKNIATVSGNITDAAVKIPPHGFCVAEVK